jgi:hypothetical protein
MTYEDKEIGSLTILNRGNEGNLHLNEDNQKNIALVKSHPPTSHEGKYAQKEVIN